MHVVNDKESAIERIAAYLCIRVYKSAPTYWLGMQLQNWRMAIILSFSMNAAVFATCICISMFSQLSRCSVQCAVGMHVAVVHPRLFGCIEHVLTQNWRWNKLKTCFIGISVYSVGITYIRERSHTQCMVTKFKNQGTGFNNISFRLYFDYEEWVKMSLFPYSFFLSLLRQQWCRRWWWRRLFLLSNKCF